MAIDSAEKRFSIMGMANPTIKLVMPSGSVTASERATFIDVYGGIALSGAAAFVAFPHPRGVHAGTNFTRGGMQ